MTRRPGHSKLVYNKATRTIDIVATRDISRDECPYCGGTDGLRYLHKGHGPVPPEVTCEVCFTPCDDGPSFDDLKAVQS